RYCCQGRQRCVQWRPGVSRILRRDRFMRRSGRRARYTRPMNRRPIPSRDLPRAQLLAERAFASLERFLHLEAVSGIVLLAAAAIALLWANSPLSHSYHELWHTPLSFGVGGLQFSQSLHF